MMWNTDDHLDCSFSASQASTLAQTSWSRSFGGENNATVYEELYQVFH
jgi:hypothetical protein